MRNSKYPQSIVSIPLAILFSVFFLLACISPSKQKNDDLLLINQDSLREEQARQKAEAIYIKNQNHWVDSLMDTLTVEQRIGQLFIADVYPKTGETHFKKVETLIKDYHIGGLMFSQGSPLLQAHLTNRFQSKSKTPLLVSLDAEWGLAMRLDSTLVFPYQMTLGAINDPELVYKMGQEVARQCKRIGVHMNFAPVADINSNPKNPVIGVRSFGENKEKVAQNSITYMKGLQDSKVIAVGKHFPGHGDTDKDSHLTLPLVKHDRNRIENIELYPFRAMVEDSLLAMMVAHLYIPAYESRANRPTSLSYTSVTTLLKDSLGFEGLVITDGMGMKGVTKYFGAGEAEVEALLAGNDVLLLPQSVPKAIEAIQKALKDERISQAEIDKKVRKILKAKYFVGLNEFKKVKIENLYQDLHTKEAKQLNFDLHQKAITFVKNDNSLLPLNLKDSLKISSLVIGKGKNTVFQKELSKEGDFKAYQISNKNASQAVFDAMHLKVKNDDVVIIGLFGVNQRTVSKSFGVSWQTRKFISKLAKETKVVLVVFGNAYSLKVFENSSYLVAAYTDKKIMQEAVSEVLFGKVSTQAQLPISASPKLKEGLGFEVK
jgi:beta-glucosidase-like glycosyl hydrolase